MTAGRGLAVTLVFLMVACSGGEGETDTSAAEPDFPANYASDYTEVRNCRGSGDHNLNNIRILASPSALAPYRDRLEPFPVDAVVLKEEYDFGDKTCEGPIVRWTVMRKLAEGSAPDTLDWAWQDVDDARAVVEVDGSACVGCHTGCGVPPEGYEGTCAVP